MVWVLDRLFRDAEDALCQTKAWDKAGIALHLGGHGRHRHEPGVGSGPHVPHLDGRVRRTV